MNGATFKAVRERLGLTTRWVADELGVAERSVHRWEADTSPIPDGVVEALESWETLHVNRVAAADDVVVIPRTGERDGLPASWWRSVAAEARREHGSEIDYEGEQV